MQQRFFIESYFFYSTCFGHHYAHHQELKRRWLLPVVFRAVVFKLLVWCGAEGYVSGLQDAAASCKILILKALFLSIIDKHKHTHFFTFKTVLV